MNTFADQLAAELLGQVGMPQDPPIDIEGLALALGVTAVVETDMVEDGRLKLEDGSPTIYVRNRDTTLERRRFTIAHEVGHLALGLTNHAGIARRQHHSDEERMCDEIAAAILIPNKWLIRRFGKHRHNLSTLRQLAHTTETSLAAALVRCREVLGWAESLVRWRHDGTKWRYQGGAGIPRTLHPYIHSAPATDAALNAIPHFGDRDGAMPMMLRGRTSTVHGQFSVSRSSAVALVRFPA